MMGQGDVGNLVFEANMPPLTAVIFPWLHTAHPLPSEGGSAAEGAIP